DEPIDCHTVNSQTIRVTVSDPDDPGETLIVPVDLACSGNRIVIDPGSSLDLYEGQTVTVSVGQLDPQNAAQTIRDLAGNAMRGRQEFTNNETWTFVVRLSEFTWARDFIVASAAYESGGTVTAKLVNGNETDVDFDLSGLPVWLTPSTASGTVVAGGSLAIGFTYPDSLGRSVIEQDPDSTATFLATVTADVVSPPLSVPLDLRIDVTCGPPAWTPDPGLYEYSMTAVLELYDDLGVQQTDPGDIVAAFVGNQLRGAAHPSADGKAYLTIYSNRSAGEIVRFRLFDAESCHVFGTASPTLRFVVDDRRTTVLTFEDTLPADLQTIEASTGWTWFSLNLEPQGGGGAMSILDVLGNVNPSPGDIVKSKTAFSIADENGEWQGALFDLDNKKGYQIRLRDGGTILHEGEPVPGDLSINLSTRWNWIGYPPAFPRPVDEVILNPTPTMGELIKSQTEFAQFDGSSWVGSLTMLEPGKGYKLYRNDGSLGGSLRFPSNPEPFARKSHGTGLSAEVALQAADGLGWTLPEQGFEYNMTLVVQVDVGGELAAGPAVVAAFVGDEVRGVAELVPVGVGKTMAFLMVHSDEPDGEAVTFQVHDLSSDELFEARNELEFRADANLGSIGSPWTVRATPLGSSQVPTSFQLYAN
ncbi:MAG: hypothetical protein KDA27_28320, partial [Candidatus Eisenbacteria bacterium]|nr:hypothetical protein [Candidatus Eisenbacteria bacterium]